jgi:hypothetical protein
VFIVSFSRQPILDFAMKKLNRIGIASIISLSVVAARADENVTNRFSFSSRLGFNISAKFKGRGTVAPPRLTPDGSLYNYDNGYVLNDVSDSFGGETWNWGYDNSAQQVDSANSLIGMSRTSSQPGSSRMDDDPALGAEIVFSRQLWADPEKLRFGVEIAGNYLNIGLSQNDRATGTSVTDFYPYTPGTTPPLSPAPGTGLPYQGTFNGPGFTIFTNIASSVTNTVSFSDKQRFDADLWGFRFGPYLEIPLSERINLNLSGGLAVGFLNADASWKQTSATSSASGSGHDFEVLWGGYVGGNLSWRLTEDWTLIGGALFQNLGTYQHSFDGRKVEVDLANSVFVTVGIGYSF